MSCKVQKLEIAAILALAQSFSDRRFQPAGLPSHVYGNVEREERTRHVLALAEQRREQKKARRAAQFKKAA
jgi:hypothetical protein